MALQTFIQSETVDVFGDITSGGAFFMIDFDGFKAALFSHHQIVSFSFKVRSALTNLMEILIQSDTRQIETRTITKKQQKSSKLPVKIPTSYLPPIVFIKIPMLSNFVSFKRLFEAN